MASSTSINTTGTTTAFMEQMIYWCNSCNSDVSPNATAGLLCPNCNSPLPSNNRPSPNHLHQNSSRSSLPSFVDPLVPSDSTRTSPLSTVTASDDNFLLDSPYLHRLIHHLTHSNDSSPSTTATTSRYHSPTSKSAIEAIPTVMITPAFLDVDPIVLCAVCKDQFVIDDDTKQLPCKHMYHPDCILPWLSQHNSCPVCRFQMPKEAVGGDLKVRRRLRSRVLRLGDLMEDVDDEAMLGIGFSNLHHQYLQSEINPETMSPFTHIGETVEVDVLPDSDRTGGRGNVSGWRNWPVDGDAVDDEENVTRWRHWPVNGRAVDGVNAGWVDDADGVPIP